MAHRDLAAEQTRARIMRAARELLSDPAGISAFTIEAVSKQARVARMTVYYQFQSKRGLLEALFDDVARGGEMARLKDAFREPDPRKLWTNSLPDSCFSGRRTVSLFGVFAALVLWTRRLTKACAPATTAGDTDYKLSLADFSKVRARCRRNRARSSLTFCKCSPALRRTTNSPEMSVLRQKWRLGFRNLRGGCWAGARREGMGAFTAES
ncbi:MAG: hypothetical protein DMG68_01190 [Acidobacteria bacterium]|nr:MAG: hypothetical protein DMG68_01190 [Acidobacteriota bacterium]